MLIQNNSHRDRQLSSRSKSKSQLGSSNKYATNNYKNQNEHNDEGQLNKYNSHRLFEFEQNCPQLKIYNRNFYLREIVHTNIQQQNDKKIKQLSQTRKLQDSSYQILKQKLENNIKKVMRQVKANQKNDHEEMQFQNAFTFEQTSQIILKLNPYFNRGKSDIELQKFLSQLWLYLNNYEIQSTYLDKSLLIGILLILMDPRYFKPQQIGQLSNQYIGRKYDNMVQKKRQLLEEYQQLRDEMLQDIEIWRLWYGLRQKYNRFQKHNESKSGNKYGQMLTFKPQINQKSRMYAEKSLQKYLSTNKLQHQKSITKPHFSHSNFNSNQQENQLRQYLSKSKKSCRPVVEEQLPISYHQLLYKRKLEKQKISRRLNFQGPQMQQYLSRNSKKGTPEEIDQIVNKMYFVRQKRQDKNFKALKQSQQLQKCTFYPVTNTGDGYLHMQKQSSGIVRGFDSQVERLARGRKQREKQKQLYENLGKPKQSAVKSSKQPSFIQRDAPRLILQINIGDGLVQKIKLKGQEDPKIVAKKFVSKHGLDESMIAVLQDLVQQNLRNL